MCEISMYADVYVPDTKAGKPLLKSSLNRIQYNEVSPHTS